MSSTKPKKPRYRFAAFTVSPSRRALLRDGEEVPLIPRYFDLLVLLIERRNEAVHRRDIFDIVWSDVVVSDGALSQAIRILRRTLGDDPREPTFIRTVSRHGYRFVFPEVLKEDDETPLSLEVTNDGANSQPKNEDAFDTALEVLLDASTGESLRREAAEMLHTLDTSEALRRLDRLPGHETARAILRDTRWDVPGAGDVPLYGQPGGLGTTWALVKFRFELALRLAGRRWASAVTGGAFAGLVAGLLGGLVLRFGPGSTATDSVLVALPLVGLLIGGLGAAGVGAGLSAAETLTRSSRTLALLLLGSLGGGAIGALTHLVGRLTLEGLFGRDLSPIAGGLEGLTMGFAAGLGYAVATPRYEGGMASPRGVNRIAAAAVTGLSCAIAGMLLAVTGRHLGAMSLDFMAKTFPGSQVGLDPIARLLGETTPGAVTRIVISAWEGWMFGFGLIVGLTRRPRSLK